MRVKVITACPECGNEVFNVECETSKVVHCEECGTSSEFSELFTGYIEVRGVLTYE